MIACPKCYSNEITSTMPITVSASVDVNSKTLEEILGIEFEINEVEIFECRNCNCSWLNPNF